MVWVFFSGVKYLWGFIMCVKMSVLGIVFGGIYLVMG